jgi:UDP-N-acetylmuramoyl-L-alanyl-D-glutamate--2,6-diaminopimelate ligase
MFMRLDELIRGLGPHKLTGDGATEISCLAYDSREVKPGSLFIAMKGEKSDGAAFIGAAVGAGAVAVLSELPADPALPVAWVRHPEPREALADLAGVWHGFPDRELKLVAVTGTNGKTTVAHLVRRIIAETLGPAGMIGTIAYHTGVRQLPATLTTPEALPIRGMLREMVDIGCVGAVMEASSVAIDRHRVRGLAFDALTFTNLTRDHLDYHGDMERYYQAKRALFQRTKESDPVAAIHIDDAAGRRLAEEISLRRLTFGAADDADIRCRAVRLSLDGTEIEVELGGTIHHLRSRLIGRFNAENMLAAFASACALGCDPAGNAAAIALEPPVRGRMERIAWEGPFTVLVDYAHTDDGLLKILQTANELARRRVIVVFGCGGDRDRGKRPLMGQHAVRLSDIAVLTSDNPRTEDPQAIIADVLAGIAVVAEPRAKLHTIPDRREAIATALRLARPGDVVLLAGKGHEEYQVIGTTRSHFDDREEALQVLMTL